MQERSNHKNPAWVIKAVTPCDNFTLELLFNDNSRRIFDVSEYIKARPTMPALRDKSLFMWAHVVGPAVAWNDDLDIAPEYLYAQSRAVFAGQ